LARQGNCHGKATRREHLAAGGTRAGVVGADCGATGSDTGRGCWGLHKRRIASSRSALWRFFKRHKITLKKTLHAAEQERADVARARRRWIGAQGLLDTTRLVFIDETAANTKMARLNGRCPRGERLVGRVPFGHWKTITFVAGLRHNGLTAPMVVDGSMNGETFLAYVE
jgi:hypothetical protein